MSASGGWQSGRYALSFPHSVPGISSVLSVGIKLLRSELDRIRTDPAFNDQDVSIDAVSHCQERINPEEYDYRNSDKKAEQ